MKYYVSDVPNGTLSLEYSLKDVISGREIKTIVRLENGIILEERKSA